MEVARGKERKHSLRPADDRMLSGTEWPFGYHEPTTRRRAKSWDCSIQLVTPYYHNIQRGPVNRTCFISASGAILDGRPYGTSFIPRPTFRASVF